MATVDNLIGAGPGSDFLNALLAAQRGTRTGANTNRVVAQLFNLVLKTDAISPGAGLVGAQIVALL